MVLIGISDLPPSDATAVVVAASAAPPITRRRSKEPGHRVRFSEHLQDEVQIQGSLLHQHCPMLVRKVKPRRRQKEDKGRKHAVMLWSNHQNLVEQMTSCFVGLTSLAPMFAERPSSIETQLPSRAEAKCAARPILLASARERELKQKVPAEEDNQEDIKFLPVE
eukprot:gb/GFBE01017444.1/.p1 GENE.gb/GFBE01017444.1/~~gb/GFBE01017444.1/.p1  ORF type:complete len:165 (+),score=28.87 gb/GFBE01017444.1/:1-495(+)